MPPLDQFHRQNIDLYIPAGDSGNWLGALRDPAEPVYGVVRDAAAGDRGFRSTSSTGTTRVVSARSCAS